MKREPNLAWRAARRVLLLVLSITLLAASGPGILAAGLGSARKVTSDSDPEATTAAVSDDLNACTLNTDLWAFTNPLGDATKAMVGTFTSDAWLSISVPAGTAHDVWLDGNFAPRITQPVSDQDFQVEAKFESGLNGAFQTQGILVEQDATSFLRLEFYSNGSNTVLYVAALEPGTTTPLKVTYSNARTIADQGVAPLYMKVQRQADQWQVLYSLDGLDWQAGPGFSHALNVSAVGVYAGNAGSNPPAHTGTVDYFFNAAFPIDPEDAARNILAVSSINNGRVDVSPEKPAYACFETVMLEAIPDPDWRFREWGGDLAGAENPTSIEMTGSRAITATFEPCRYTLTVGTQGQGVVDRDPAPPYPCDSLVTLTPRPDTNWRFVDWSGPHKDDLTDKGDGTWSLLMDEDKEVTAVFGPPGHVLRLRVEPAGSGTVERSPDKVTYADDERVTLAPKSAPGAIFDAWSGPDKDELDDNGDGTWSLTMNGDKELTARFTQFTYSVDVTRVGSGRVRNSPGNPYLYGEEAELEPIPTAGWRFSGWSGPDAGELVDNTDGTWSLVVAGNKAVTATFVEIRVFLPVVTRSY